MPLKRELFVIKIMYLIFMIELILVGFKVFKMECQVDKNEHFRHHLLFAFNRDTKATEPALEVCEVYGQKAMSLRTIKNWFK